MLSVLVISLLQIEAFNTLIGFSSVPYRQIPTTVIPAAVLFILYELMTAIHAKCVKRRKGSTV